MYVCMYVHTHSTQFLLFFYRYFPKNENSEAQRQNIESTKDLSCMVFLLTLNTK